MKSEPSVYSIDHLAKDESTAWECIRNYQARNFMAQEMNIGDQVLFYHSNAEPAGIAGLAFVCSEAKPDKTQFDKKSDYYDKKATPAQPRWFCVDIKFSEKFDKFLDLNLLRQQKELSQMLVLKRGQRLSIQPVTEKDFKFIITMSQRDKALFP